MLGTGQRDVEEELMAQLGAGTVFMMGDNPGLVENAGEIELLNFFPQRFTPFTRNHLLQSAMVALRAAWKRRWSSGLSFTRHFQRRADPVITAIGALNSSSPMFRKR